MSFQRSRRKAMLLQKGLIVDGADRFGLRDRGLLQKGQAADITVFDPQQIRDNTTAQATDRLPTGVRHVFINGLPALQNGEPVDDARAGAVLRR